MTSLDTDTKLHMMLHMMATTESMGDCWQSLHHHEGYKLQGLDGLGSPRYYFYVSISM